MNGAAVIGRTRDTIFVRLPDALQRPCGTCRCPYCTAHPERPPMWDTLAVSVEKSHPVDYTWTVHMPDPSSVRDAIEAGYVHGPAATVVHGGRKR